MRVSMDLEEMGGHSDFELSIHECSEDLYDSLNLVEQTTNNVTWKSYENGLYKVVFFKRRVVR